MGVGRAAPWWSPARWFGRASGRNDGASEQQVAAEVAALCTEDRFDAALEVLQRALARQSSSKVLLELLGALHFKRGEPQAAVAAVRQAETLGAPNAAIQNLLGMCHMQSGDEASALPCFVRACEIDPGFVQAQANAAWLSFAMGRPSGGDFRRWLESAVPGQGDAIPQAPRRLHLPQVTLVCVDCAYHELALYALRKSMAQCEFGAVQFFTDRDFAVEGIEVVRIERIASAAEYSNFLIHDLGAHVRTDFVLVVQYDGFVLHPQAWDAEFLQYDYIGAPIPISGGSLVGNGGFSLRSKKLLNALTDPLIAQYDARNAAWQEDMAICVQYREHLEREYGVRIAPAALAAKFSAEFTRPHAGAFGFHGLLNLAHLVYKDFSDLEPPGTTRIAINLYALTPLGVLSVGNSVDTLANQQFGGEVRTQVGASGGAA